MRAVSSQGSLPQLKLNDSITSWQDKADYLEFKPNFFGLGINFNKIIGDIFAFYNSKKQQKNNQGDGGPKTPQT